MKSLTAVCQTGASMPAMKPQSGRVARPPQHRTNGENAEMRMYLSKLKDLVPFMPKNRKLSKLEIIQHVIDYICELQTELESHPDIDSYDGARELLATPNRHFAIDGDDEGEEDEDEYAADSHDNDVTMLSNAERLAADAAIHQQQHQQSSPATRQPLVDRNAPNMILPASALINAAMQLQQLQQQQQQITAAAAAAAAVPVSSTISTTHSTPATTTEKDSSRRSC